MKTTGEKVVDALIRAAERVGGSKVFGTSVLAKRRRRLKKARQAILDILSVPEPGGQH